MSSLSDKDNDSPSPARQDQPPSWQTGQEKYDIDQMDSREYRRRSSIADGEIKHNQLGWVRLTICLIVEAIALGKPERQVLERVDR